LRAEIGRREDLQAELEYRATHDALTAVMNRRGFFEHAERVPVDGCALVVVDVDRFKPINDLYGHAVGDRLLQTVAGVLRGVAAPAGGVTARLGGDEFVVLLPPGCLSSAELIRAGLADLSITLPDGPPLHVSASVGVSVVADAQELEVALATADVAMYERKRELAEPGATR
jgi:diguanylate cyclase (GGDEF)-like protein